jgi:hypothetical protein
MANWSSEIAQLHEFFGGYLSGVIDSLERLESALAEDFEMVGPNGENHNKTKTMGAVRESHGSMPSVQITTENHRLLLAERDLVVASYIEVHEFDGGGNRRASTVVFSNDPNAPNGLLWRRVQETRLSSH